MLTIADIDPIDLVGLTARHTAPMPATVTGVVTDATYALDNAAWAVELVDGTGGGPTLGVDLDGAAIAAAGAAAWRPGQIAAVTLGDWAGRAWSASVQGTTLDDVLALPATHDPSWPRLITHVELLRP